MFYFLLHPSLRVSNNKEHRYAMVVLYSMITLTVFYIFYVVYYALKFPITYQQNINNFLGIVLFIIFYIVLRLSKKIKWPLAFINLACLPLMYSSIYIRGGIYSADISWMTLTIISTIVFIDIWFGLICSLISFGYLAFLFYQSKYDAATNQFFLHFLNTEGSFHYFFTWTFVFVLTAAIMMAFTITIKRTNQKLDRISSEKINDLEERLQLLTNKISVLRTNISQDFHDEMGNKLATIGILASMLENKMNQSASKESMQPLLAEISDKSKEIFEGTKDFIWAIDWKNDYIIELYHYICNFAENLLNVHQINVTCTSNIAEASKIRMPPTVSRQLIFICKELFTNSLKHAQCNNIGIAFLLEENILTIEIHDDGKGFDFHNIEKRGINNILTRTRKINAVSEFYHSKENTGTRFKLKVPIHF